MRKLLVTVNSEEIQKISKTIGENLRKFNESRIGPFSFKPFAIYAIDDADNVIGGVKGEIFEKLCNIHSAWVQEADRGKGLGTEIFKKLEAFANENQCKIIQLDTAEFQARGFYEKIGFTVVATLPENFAGYTTYIMRKNLGR